MNQQHHSETAEPTEQTQRPVNIQGRTPGRIAGKIFKRCDQVDGSINTQEEHSRNDRNRVEITKEDGHQT